jgi:hypothetical protein
LAEADLEPLWTVENADQLVAVMYDVLPGAVETWSAAAQSVAAEWYDEEREREEIAGTFQAIVEPIKDLGVYALVGWATEPLLQPEPDFAAARYRAVGGVQKRLANSANYTITGSSAADPQARGWMRKTRPNACNFCIMVASRGAVYTEKTARFACHERCYCRAAPAWGGRPLPVEPYKPSERDLSEAQRQELNRQARAWINSNLK